MEQLDNRLTEEEIFDLVMADGGELYGNKLAYFLANQLISLKAFNELMTGSGTDKSGLRWSSARGRA